MDSVYVSDGWLSPDGIIDPLEDALAGQGDALSNYDGVIAMYATGSYDPEPDPIGSVYGGGFALWLPYPYEDLGYSCFGLDGAIAWLFTHEFNHQLDWFLERSGHPGYVSPDVPLNESARLKGRYGEHFDYNAAMLRSPPLSWWFDLINADIDTVADLDNDGIPDDDPKVPIDEKQFGSNPNLADTDNDGLMDLDEVMAGIYRGSDPNNSDTDGDGKPDGIDLHPLYAINEEIPKATRIIDGNLEADWNEFGHYDTTGLGIVFYMNWDDTMLYLGAKILTMDTTLIIHMYMDANSDSWFWGKDNYAIRLSPMKAKIDNVVILDCTNNNIRWNYTLVNKNDLVIKCTQILGIWNMELGIPKNDATGLYLNQGDTIGLRFTFEPGGSYFEPWHFVYCTLGGPTGVDAQFIPQSVVTSIQNEPNPFTRSTVISCRLSESAASNQWTGVSLKIYDLSGRLIRTLIDEPITSCAQHSVDQSPITIIWDGTDESGNAVVSGIYFCGLTIQSRGKVVNLISVKKMVLLR